MSRHVSYRRSEIISGLFVVLALVVFALFAFKVGRFDLMGLLKPPTVTCTTYFNNVRTLQEGSKVRVGGREVGEVVGLQLVEDPAHSMGEATSDMSRLVNEVTFELFNPELRLDPSSARLVIAQDSLLAPHFLELDPGRWPSGQPPATLFEADLQDGLVLASEESQGIEELMAMAGPAVQELTTILSTVNRDLLTRDNLDKFNRVMTTLDETLVEGQKIATTINRDVLARNNIEALDRMIQNLDRAAADGQRVAARLDTLLDAEKDPRLDQLLTDVSTATRDLRVNMDAISSDLRQLLGKADRVIDQTDTEIAEATRRLQRTLWQGEMALRKIRTNPAVLLFGDDETDLEARDVDLTEIRLRGRARPYEQRDERDEP